MFKFISVFALSTVILSAWARPQEGDHLATVLSDLQNNDGNGNFQNSFETSNGIKIQNEGHIQAVKVPVYDDAGNQTGEKDAEASGWFNKTKKKSKYNKSFILQCKEVSTPTLIHLEKW